MVGKDSLNSVYFFISTLSHNLVTDTKWHNCKGRQHKISHISHELQTKAMRGCLQSRVQ